MWEGKSGPPYWAEGLRGHSGPSHPGTGLGGSHILVKVEREFIPQTFIVSLLCADPQPGTGLQG